MAVLPCKVGMHPHRFRNVNVYAGWFVGPTTQRLSGRYCPPHWNEIERSLAQFEVDADRGTLGDPSAEGLCLTCLKPVEELGGQVFLTSYPAKDQRKDYWARVHVSCNLPGPLAGTMNSQ